jgi:hypothetical protein
MVRRKTYSLNDLRLRVARSPRSAVIGIWRGHAPSGSRLNARCQSSSEVEKIHELSFPWRSRPVLVRETGRAAPVDAESFGTQDKYDATLVVRKDDLG